MDHQDLVNHIEGSFLKKQFLEAFLVQSAYIEGLLKLYADYNFWQETKDKIEKSQLLKELNKKLTRYSLNELIEFLFRTKLISEDQKNELNEYRERRNKVLHDLISEIRKEPFEKELKEICEKGKKIIESKEFIEMAEMIKYLEGFKKASSNPMLIMPPKVQE